MSTTYYGQCLCGAIRYRISGEPLTVYACHCTDCQRRTGSVLALSMIIRRAQLELLAGSPAAYTAALPDGRRKSGRLCADCGTRLWGEPRNTDVVVIQPGTLDQPAGLVPVAHQWVRSAQPWFQFATDAIVYETQPTTPAEMLKLWKENRLPHVHGTAGYAEEADSLIPRFNSVSFLQKYLPVQHLLPTMPVRVLDVGAGTGSDAQALAALGHEVVAVEPLDQFRAAGQQSITSANIRWVNDSLPALSLIRTATPEAGTTTAFGLILVSAVWHHLSPDERRQSMATLAALLDNRGMLVISLRHGTAPPSRRVFVVSAEETTTLAAQCGLDVLLQTEAESLQTSNRAAGVNWTWLVFRNNGGQNTRMPSPKNRTTLP